MVLDSGAVDRATADRWLRSVIKDMVRAGVEVLVPVAILAEAITGTGRDAPANQTIKRFGTTEADEALARHAGHLRYRSMRQAGGRRLPSGIDAIVAAHAASAFEAIVFTTDPSDLRRLLAGHSNVRVEAI